MRFSVPILAAAAALSIFASSCKTTNLPYTRTPSDPYVQLKDGKKFTGSSTERTSGVFVKDRITLDDTTFKTKDVAFYSTGGSTFANVGRKTFATQVGAGKINLYKYETIQVTTTSNGGSSAQKRIYYYIQAKEGAPLMTLNYRNLSPLVKPKTPEFDMLQHYRATRTVSRAIGYSALGLFVSGAALAFSSNNSALQTTGAAMMGVGAVATMPWFVISFRNQRRLLKTVVIADKIEKDTNAKHKRVQ